jgi:hypothetical protein
MLPPLLSLLLECAKKTDQTVVSIALGALVHLIEVGGHQFSDGDWETLLKSIRYFLKFLFLPNFFFPKRDESVKRDLKEWNISKDLAMDRSAWRLAINVPEP